MQDGDSTFNGAVPPRAQLFGVLSKKHSSSQSGSSGKWAKRFFVVRDGFLLYYHENERREYEKHNYLNLHPKGLVPLGNCEFLPTSDLGHPFSLQITSIEMATPLIIAMDTEYERDKWLDVLQQSSRITWNNAQLGDVMIRQLENQGLKMAKEKQVYFDKLQLEAMALHDEKIRADELEHVNEELGKERLKLEQLASELSEEYEQIKNELTETITTMKTVEESKHELIQTTNELQSRLEELENEREKMQSQLTRQNSGPNSPVSQVPSDTNKEALKLDLVTIQEQTQHILMDKAEAENRLRDFLERERQLEEEKQMISNHAAQLKESLEELKAQKAVAESELKEEILARRSAERRLVEAEQRLDRLERGIMQHGTDGRPVEDSKEEMICDVKAIKRFFESLAVEAKLDADKSVMVKNAVHARKVIVRRAQTLKYETLRKQRASSTQSRELVLDQFRQEQSNRRELSKD